MVWRPGDGATKHLTPIDEFAPAEYGRFTTEQRLTVDELVDLASTWSPVAVRDDRNAVLAEVWTLGARVAGADGTLVFSYVSDCYRYLRLG